MDQRQVVTDSIYHQTTLGQPARAERDGDQVQKACSVMHLLTRIPLSLPEIIAGNNALICTDYGERQLVKIYVKFGNIECFTVLSHKLHF